MSKGWDWQAMARKPEDMTTVRKLLNEVEFDWENGRIFYHNDGTTVEVDRNHILLEKEFDSGYGLSESPIYTCYDDLYVYTHHEYDGSEWYEKDIRSPEAMIKLLGVNNGE